MNIVILGLTITSSWGNGHATTFRGLVKELVKRGHQVTFLERDKPWYADNRDLPDPDFCELVLYESVEELRDRHILPIRGADAVMVGSYVPEGVDVGRLICQEGKGTKIFYDIDTPVTLAKLERQDHEYLAPGLIPLYDLYLSFTGGPILREIESTYGSPCARPLYCSVDVDNYFPMDTERIYDLGYLGTYSDDRQPPLERLMLEPSRQWREGSFIVAGPLYPRGIQWSENIRRVEHLPPSEHRLFYNQQRFTMNITRADMIRAGYSPSVRLFEAAACGVPIISDLWRGLDSLFALGHEILISCDGMDTLRYLRELPEKERVAIGERARKRVLSEHTAQRRAEQLEGYIASFLERPSRGSRRYIHVQDR